MSMRNCVISAVGKNSLHKMWTEGNGNFDLHLIVYDDSLELFCNDVEYICQIKGNKLKVIYKYFETHPHFKDMYDYFFFPDDDIQMDAPSINALFETMHHYKLKIAQPSLRMSYYTWPHTLHNRYCKLRYTNFVEMMVPCFSQEVLQNILFTFNENETGWGTEYHWPILIKATQHDMAIIDEVSVIQTRPIQAGQSIHNRELTAYLQKYGLETRLCCYDAVSTQSASMYCCDENTFMSIRAMLQHWIDSEGITSLNIGEDGYFGYVHFLFLLADITQSKKYADAALHLLEKVQDGLGMVKSDMSFLHGITGCCWLIEYLVGENLLQEDPQEILTDIDEYILQYGEGRKENLTLTELSGIGKYGLAKYRNRPDSRNKKALQNIAMHIKAQLKLPQSFHDIMIFLDALEILHECDTDIVNYARSLERLIYQVGLSQVELVYCQFRLCMITYDEHLHICVRERMKNLVPQLMNLPDALMLAEILYYKHKSKTK